MPPESNHPGLLVGERVPAGEVSSPLKSVLPFGLDSSLNVSHDSKYFNFKLEEKGG